MAIEVRKVGETMKKILATAIAVSAISTSAGYGQQSATANLNVTVNNTVSISDVDDVSLIEQSPGNYSGSDDICMSGTLGFVNAAFSGDNGPAPDGYVLTNTGTGAEAPFYVEYLNNVDGQANAVDIPSLDGLPAPVNCDAANPSGTLVYYFYSSPGMDAGDYVGTLTILLSGE